MIYHGDRGDKPDEIRLSKEIFGLTDPADAYVDVKARIIYDSKQGDIINQYVTFARVFDAQIALYGYTREAVEETLRICKDQNVLSKFLAEEEVAKIMFTMADEEKAKKFWQEDLLEEGRNEGRAEGRVEGEEKGIIAAIKAMMKNLKLSSEQAMEALEIPSSKWSHYTSML